MALPDLDNHIINLHIWQKWSLQIYMSSSYIYRKCLTLSYEAFVEDASKYWYIQFRFFLGIYLIYWSRNVSFWLSVSHLFFVWSRILKRLGLSLTAKASTRLESSARNSLGSGRSSDILAEKRKRIYEWKTQASQTEWSILILIDVILYLRNRQQICVFFFFY